MTRVVSKLMASDLAILQALQRRGCLSARQLAITTGMSKNAAWRRKAHLEEKGVILGYRAVIAPELLGAEQDMVVSITLAATPLADARAFESGVKTIEGVVSLLRVGLSAYWVRVALRKSLIELEELVRAQGAPVLKFDVTPVLDEIIAYRDPPLRGP